MNTSQAPEQGGELHEPPTEVDRGQCEHYQQHIYVLNIIYHIIYNKDHILYNKYHIFDIICYYVITYNICIYIIYIIYHIIYVYI